MLITAGTIALCEPFFPNATVKDPGAIYLVANALVAYRYGLRPGLLSAAILVAYIAAGTLIPTSAFEYTAKNEVRVAASAIIFALTSALIALVQSRLHQETARAAEAHEEAEREIERRRRAELDLKESEELRRIVVETSTDAIVTVAETGEILLWNQHAEAIFGWSGHDAVGAQFLERVTLTSPAGSFEMFKSGASESQFSRTLEAEVLRRDGSKLPIEWYVVPHRSSRGRVFVLFIRDVTERKAAEAAIQALNASLEERVSERTAELRAKNEELEGFSYAISHDMRTPLRAIVAYSRLVLEDEGERVSEEGRSHLERLATAALRMSLLVDDLLKYAQLGNHAVELKNVDLSEIAESVAAELATEYRSAKISIQPGIAAEADPGLVTLVLANLLGNACKYAKPGQPAIVRFGTDQRDGGTVYFVADDGIGFDMQYAGRLFRPFERLHTQEEYPGTGIGLANVRRCVVRQGGEVWLESEPGRGTTVFFTIGQANQPAAPDPVAS